jgi:hypothetical protein
MRQPDNKLQLVCLCTLNTGVLISLIALLMRRQRGVMSGAGPAKSRRSLSRAAYERVLNLASPASAIVALLSFFGVGALR